jgi:hypothetical protein
MDEFARQVLDMFRDAQALLGPDVATLETRDAESGTQNPYLEIRLTPKNSRAAPIVAYVLTEVTLVIGRNDCRLELEDLMNSGSTTDAVKLGRQGIDAVIAGRYYEKIQRLPEIGIVAAIGYLPLGGRVIDFGRGFLVPFLKTDVWSYEPYHPAADDEPKPSAQRCD